MNTSKWTKMTGIVVLIFLLQFKPPFIMVSSIEGMLSSINFIEKIMKPFENLTAFAEEASPDSDLTTVTDAEPDSETNPNPEPETNPEPDTRPSPNPNPNPNPNPEPEIKPDPTKKPTPKPDGSDRNPKPNSNTTPRPDPKPNTNPTKKPVVNEDGNKGTGRSKTTIKESIYTHPGNLNNTSETANKSLETDRNNEEIVGKDEINVDEVPEEEINLNEFSIDRLMNMLETGEIKWKLKADKYLIMLTEGKGQRELTTEEAIKLGLIVEDTEEVELVKQQDEVDDSNELISETEEAEVKLLSDVSKNGKVPYYISAFGLITVLVGAVMYFIQWRKN